MSTPFKKYNITAPKQYEKNGEIKTTYPQVGKLIVWEADGDKRKSATIELFMFPGVTYKAFPDEPRENNQAGRTGGGFNQNVKKQGGEDNQDIEYPEEEINLDDIPF